jgi:CRP/FNR family transcriptional regulator, anaerobic regulatory protein
MLNEAEWHNAIELLPFLADRAAPLTEAFVNQATLLRIPAQATIFSAGDACSAFAVLASGVVRVFTIGETGREITLYRFTRGESCILTASCILSTQEFPAIAVVEEPAEAYSVSSSVFQAWIDRHAPWRAYVFQLLAQRLSSVMSIIEEVAFRRMDVRIAEFLLRRCPAADPVLNLTHQQIAAELGTSREVVSRILADFAAAELVLLGRGSIAVRDRDGLARRAVM